MATQTLSLYQLMDKHKLTTKDIEFAIQNLDNIKETVADLNKAQEILQLIESLELNPNDVKILIECYQNISLVLSSMSIIKARAIKLNQEDFDKNMLTWWNEILEARKTKIE